MSKINTRHPIWDDDDIEYFQCDCHSREHTIYAYADKLGDEDTGKILYDGINLRFVVGRYDTEVGYSGHAFIRFFKRMRWRFRMAYAILTEGFLEYEDDWIPERRSLEQIRGKKEIVRLINFLATRHIAICKREMEARTLTPEELADYEKFVKDYAFYPIEKE